MFENNCLQGGGQRPHQGGAAGAGEAQGGWQLYIQYTFDEVMQVE